MNSLFAKFGSIRFWPKTMDYSKAFLIIFASTVITPDWKVLQS